MGHTTYTWDAIRYCDAFPEPSELHDSKDKCWVFFSDTRLSSWEYILCAGKTNQWWDLRKSKKIRITLTSDPKLSAESAYLCKKSKKSAGNICIQDERSGKFSDYSTFSTMHHAIQKMSEKHTEWYLAIDLLE
jgi:hypothetical protein